MEKEHEAHYPLVLVTWLDATTITGWHPTKESLEFEPEKCQTAGFLLKDDDTFLRVTPTLAEDGAATLDALAIPKQWVMKVETLGLAAGCKCEEAAEDCWGAEEEAGGTLELMEKLAPWKAGEGQRPEPDPIVIKPGTQVVLEIKGDEALGRPLTLDEWIKRGGKVLEWPPILERKRIEKEKGNV